MNQPTITAPMYELALKREALSEQLQNAKDAGASYRGVEIDTLFKASLEIDEEFRKLIGRKPAGHEYASFIDEYRYNNPEVQTKQKRNDQPMEELSFSAEKIVGKIVIEKSITEADIETIMVNGMEGGIGYWAKLHNDKPEWNEQPDSEANSMWATKLLIDGKTVIFSDREDEGELGGESEEFALTLEKLLKGIKQNTEERPHDCDIENGDATTYDCIIQYALFNEIVYG